MNKKGFVLMETLVVTILALVIFTILYNTVVPLLGKIDNLEKYNDIDLTYNLYHIKKFITSNPNFKDIKTEINNSTTNVKKLSCDDLDYSVKCYSLFHELGLSNNAELIIVKLDTSNKGFNTIKNGDFSQATKEYIDYIDTSKIMENGINGIVLLQNDNYVTYINWNIR